LTKENKAGQEDIEAEQGTHLKFGTHGLHMVRCGDWLQHAL
jgi:hypothetical protein